jgi:hypothetical protein
MSEAEHPEDLLRIEINWPQFSLGVVTALQAAFVKAGAKTGEWTDEFVVRQILREHFSTLIPGLNEQKKEGDYPGDQAGQRMDLRLGNLEQMTFAVEVKSDPKNLAGVESDWSKICGAEQRFKMVIFAGVTKAEDLNRFRQRFCKRDFPLSSGQSVHMETTHAQKFGMDQQLLAFIWLWYVDVPLPVAIQMRLEMRPVLDVSRPTSS